MTPFDKIIIAVAAMALFTVEIVLLSNARTKGYVITTRGDTVACTFKLALNKYQVKKDSTYYPLKTDSVKEYHLNKKNKTFRVVTMPGNFNPTFMLVIDTGKICLYQYNKLQGKASIMYLLAQKATALPVIVYGPGNTQQLRTMLAEMISDNNTVSDDLKNMRSYNPKTITDIIERYDRKAL